MMSTFFRAISRRQLLLPMLAAVAAASMLTVPATAAPVIFDIDPSLSAISITGSTDLTPLGLGPAPLDAQGILIGAPGYAGVAGFSLGDVAPWDGRLNADVTAGSIEFTTQAGGGMVPFALPSGTWAPEIGGGPVGATLGTLTYDPAAYAHTLIGGVLVTALRSVAADITSPVLPLAGGSFPAAGASFDFQGAFSGTNLELTDTTGANLFADPTSAPLGPAIPPIPNFAAPAGSLSGTALGDTLIVPIGFGFPLDLGGGIIVDLIVSGALVATVVPEPTSLALAGMCLLGLAFRRRRRA